jgi:VCBS repeat-containing protein
MKKKLAIITIALILLVAAGLVAAGLIAQAGSGDNTTGWLWGGSDDGAGNASGLGWISMNNTNPGADGSVSYGVTIPTGGGNVTGYAWSENLGWINFDPVGPYPASPNYSAKRVGDNLEGWARIVYIKEALAQGNSGGWEGWIKLKGSNYGVSIDPSTGALSGYAWSDELGWIDFSGATTEASPPSFNYSLSNSGNITVTQGDTGSNTITVTLLSGTTQIVTLSVSGLPAGASASWPVGKSCSPTCNKELSINSGTADDGTYTITVTGSPLSKTTVFDLIINPPANQPPIADANGPYSGEVNQSISFSSDGSYDPDGSIDSWEWDFDYDGINFNTDSTQKNPSNSYSTAGSYTIALRVTDDNDATDIDTAQVTVSSPAAPFADLKASKADENNYSDGSLSVKKGSNIDLKWTVENITSCDLLSSTSTNPILTATSSDDYLGYGPLEETTTFTLNCDNGSATDSVVVKTYVIIEP